MRRPLAAVLLLTAVCAALTGSLGRGVEEVPAGAAAPPHHRVLPGLQSDGFVQLPNQWRLRPVGTQLELGDFPVHIAIHPDGHYAAVLHCGYRDHEIVIVELDGGRPRVCSRVTITEGFY